MSLLYDLAALRVRYGTGTNGLASLLDHGGTLERMKVTETRNHLEALKHCLAIGRLDRARNIAAELFTWPGDVQQATPQQLREACAGVELALTEVDVDTANAKRREVRQEWRPSGGMR